MWIISLIESDSDHAVIRERIMDGEERSAVSAYIYNEVVENIQRLSEVDQREIDGLIEDFTAVVRSPHVDSPTQADVERLNLDAIRNRSEHITLGRVLGVQAKDAPIIALAVRNAVEIEAAKSDEQVTIYTSDRSFADLDPRDFGLSIEIEYLPYG